jgi:restriction system protein
MFSDFLIAFLSLLSGFWSVIMIGLIVATLKGKGNFTTLLRRCCRSLTIAWVFLGCAAFILWLLSKQPANLIPEPLNTTIFVITGIIILPLEFYLIRKEHRKKQEKIRDTKTLSDLRALSPSEFEELVADTYRAFGHRADVVGAQGDHGVDVLVHASNGEEWAVQCKRWRGDVGEPVVRDFYGAMQHLQVARGAIITSSRFTQQAIEWAKGKPIYLYDGEALLQILRKVQKTNQFLNKYGKLPAPIPNRRPPVCPKCGVPMTLRYVRRSDNTRRQLYGCPNYPNCRVVIPVEDIERTARNTRQ